jgi:hypothetical protein
MDEIFFLNLKGAKVYYMPLVRRKERVTSSNIKCMDCIIYMFLTDSCVNYALQIGRFMYYEIIWKE